MFSYILIVDYMVIRVFHKEIIFTITINWTDQINENGRQSASNDLTGEKLATSQWTTDSGYCPTIAAKMPLLDLDHKTEVGW